MESDYLEGYEITTKTESLVAMGFYMSVNKEIYNQFFLIQG